MSSDRRTDQVTSELKKLDRKISRLQESLASFRFESHQEHQEFFIRSSDENVWYDTLPGDLVARLRRA